jgi:drug/metabolite transporter (DMT)-like permease
MGTVPEISLPVALAVLGAALLHAGWNAFLKSGEDKLLDAIGIAVGSGAVALVAAPFAGVPASASWPWLAASALVHIAYFQLLAGAYRWGDLSFTYPIMRGGGPVLVALFGALALGEWLTAPQATGVALICGGVLAFASAPGRDPVALRRALAYALGNAVVIATYTVLDAQGARASGAPVSYTLWFFAVNGVVIAAIGTARRGRAVPEYVLRRWARALAGGACALGSYAIALWAMTRAPVALVAALRETAVVFAAALGVLFLGERVTRRSGIAVAAVVGGLVALRL